MSDAIVKKRKRIDWIDIAKGIGIILVIIGHTAKFGSTLRNIIFSFHMPLFFILSGFTFRRAETWGEFRKKTWKDFKCLLLPMFGVFLLSVFLRFLNSGGGDLYAFLEVLKEMSKTLLYCSGVSVHNTPALGALWFIVSMFSARLIINLLHVFIKSDKNELILLGLGLLGIIIGLQGHRLLFNFDVTLVAILFLAIGILAKKHFDFITKYISIIILICFVVFLEGVLSGTYIEMAARTYSTFSILVSIAGTLLVCEFCKIIASFKNIKTCLTFIGANSLIIFFVHHLDYYCKYFWLDHSLVLQCILRLIMCLVLALSYVWIKCEFKMIRKRIN